MKYCTSSNFYSKCTSIDYHRRCRGRIQVSVSEGGGEIRRGSGDRLRSPAGPEQTPIGGPGFSVLLKLFWPLL